MHRKKIQIRKLLPHLTLQKKKKKRTSQKKFIQNLSLDARTIQRWSLFKNPSLVGGFEQSDDWSPNVTRLHLEKCSEHFFFRELIIRRDCRLGNGRPSTNPDETMRARLISRRAAFNANSPWFAARPSLAGNLAGSNKLDISKCFPFFTFLFSVSR